MPDSAFYGLNSYHVVLAGIGVIIIVARWLPRLVSTQEPVAAPLMILFGTAFALLIPEARLLPDPRETPLPWELVSELAVIVALFGAGMRIDNLRLGRAWWPTLRLLIVAMPLTIAAIALLGVGIAGLGVAAAVLLGAVLAPTDPVLAGDVQVGPPHEGEEHPVRFTLTTEAALNDGLAFPFVYLGLALAVQGLAPSGWLEDWLMLDVAYRLIVGALAGWLGGKALGVVLFRIPGHATLADTGSDVIAIAGVLLCYGSTELVEGYGFISVTVMGLTLRRVEQDHTFHRRLHDFSEAIEHALTAGLLVALGMVLPLLFSELNLAHVVICVILLVVIRPATGWIALGGLGMARSDRAIAAIYGVRGIGAIYYLTYAASHGDFEEMPSLWALVALVILVSTILHGFTVGWAMRHATK